MEGTRARRKFGHAGTRARGHANIEGTRARRARRARHLTDSTMTATYTNFKIYTENLLTKATRSLRCCLGHLSCMFFPRNCVKKMVTH